MNLLIVDDSPTFRDRLRRLLQEAPGVRVVGEASDGRSALADIERLQPEVVILDIHMPVADGFHVLRHVQDQFADTAVIVLTTDGSAAVRQRCTALGAAAVIDKSDAATHVIPLLQGLTERRL